MQYSIVNFTEANVSSDFRIDAEYWHPGFIRNSDRVQSGEKISSYAIENILNIKSCPINAGFDYLEISGISLNLMQYRTKKIRFGEEPDRAHYILNKNDVVVSTVRPNRNAIAIIQSNCIVGSSGLCVIRANKSKVNPFFCWFYLVVLLVIRLQINSKEAWFNSTFIRKT